jgi:hypothetical protein
MAVWLVWSDGYDPSIIAAFDSEAAASAFAKGREVSEYEVWTEVPAPWTYWHVGADVYPDGIVRYWQDEKQGEGDVWLEPCDSHLNDGRVWDGHTQSHCGEHVSIFGTDHIRGRIHAPQRRWSAG